MEALQMAGGMLAVFLRTAHEVYSQMPMLQQYLVWLVLGVIVSVALLRRSHRYLSRTFHRLASAGTPQPFPELPPMTIYAGFWRRVSALVLDMCFWYLIVMLPLLYLFFGNLTGLPDTPDDVYRYGTLGIVIENIIPLILWFGFLLYKQATPGKMLIKAYIADAKTGGKPGLLQLFILYIGYFVSALPLGLGFFWAGWNRKKQGWHNLLSRTVVLQRVVDPDAAK